MLTPIFKEYEVVFPMVASTIYNPLKSFMFLIIYAIPFGMLYIYGIRRLWESLEVEKVEGNVKVEYSIRSMNSLVSLVFKDYKIIFRRTQLLGGFLAPVYMGLWWIYMVGKEGFPLRSTGMLMITIGILASITLDAVFKMELEGFETLKSLPISKKRFLLTKGLVMSTIPIFLNLTLLALSLIFNGTKALYIFPLVLSPLLASGISMKYVSKKINDVEMPNLGLSDGIVILILNLIPIVIGGILLFAIKDPISYIVVDSMIIIGSLILWGW